MDASNILQAISKSEFTDRYKELHWEGSFEEYLNMVIERPAIARNAFQRVYDMISSYGREKYTEYKKEIINAYENNHTNYPAANGILELREAVSHFLHVNEGLEYKPEQILISGGARPLIYATYQTILDSNHIIDWGALTEMEMAVVMDYCNI